MNKIIDFKLLLIQKEIENLKEKYYDIDCFVEFRTICITLRFKKDKFKQIVNIPYEDFEKGVSIQRILSYYFEHFIHNLYLNRKELE